MSGATDERINAYLAELEREAAWRPWNAQTELLEDVRSHIEVAVAEIREGGGAEVGSEVGEVPSPDETSQVRAMLSALGEPGEIVDAALVDHPTASGGFGASGASGGSSASGGGGASAGAGESGLPTASGAYGIDTGAMSASPELHTYPIGVRQSPPYPLGTADIAAVALLLLGGFLAGIGWVVGAVLLWTSTRWTRAEKLIGTLILPGGIGVGLFVLGWARAGSYTNCSESGHCVTVHTGWNPPGWLALFTLLAIVLAPAVTAVFLVNRARRRPGISPASRAGLAVIAGLGSLGLLIAVGLVAVTGSATKSPGPAGPYPRPAVEYSGSSDSGYAVPISSPQP